MWSRLVEYAATKRLPIGIVSSGDPMAARIGKRITLTADLWISPHAGTTSCNLAALLKKGSLPVVAADGSPPKA